MKSFGLILVLRPVSLKKRKSSQLKRKVWLPVMVIWRDVINFKEYLNKGGGGGNPVHINFTQYFYHYKNIPTAYLRKFLEGFPVAS